jgi:putative spermidine/putrescine transport system permease protein
MRSQADFSLVSYRAVVIALGGLGLLVMAGPVVLGLLMSFNSGQTLRFPPEGLSFRWYEALADRTRSEPVHRAAMTSLQVAVFAVLGTFLFAVPAAIGTLRLSRKALVGVEAVLLAPLVMPSLVYGFGALIAATMLGIGTSRALVIAGHIVVFAPLLYRATAAVATGLDPSLEEASATLGASPMRTLWRVHLPLLAPGIIAGAFLVFMQSFDNVSITLFLADPGTSVLPIRMWQMIEESLDARVAAISGALIAATFVLLALTQRLAPLMRERRT